MNTLKWVVILLLGMVVGSLLPYVFDDSEARIPPARSVARSSTIPPFEITDATDRDALLARIAELEALLARMEGGRGKLPPEWADDTPELLEKLLQEAYADNNVDWLLDAVRRLLAMGEDGYPILRRMIEDIAFKGKFLPTAGDFRIDQLYTMAKVFAEQEKDFIGFLNYLLIDKRTIPIMKQFTMIGAAYYVGSKADGSEELQQTLIRMFMEQGAMGGASGLIPGLPAQASQKIQVFAMAMSGDPQMIGPLHDQLRTTKDKGMQGDILGALAYLGDPSAVPLIEERLDPTEGDFRRELDALGRVGTPEAHETATKFLTDIPESKRFYRHARRYMRAGGGTSAVLLMQERIKADPTDPEIASTIGSLRRYPTKESRDTLTYVAENTPDPKVAKQANDAVMEIDRKLRGELPEAFQIPK